MTTTEGNKLIAEFNSTKSSLVDGMYFGENGMLFHPDDLRYHISWDWLMPVVEKCRDVDHYQAYTHYRDIEAMLRTLDILNVHAAVIEFINWYNTKKS